MTKARRCVAMVNCVETGCSLPGPRSRAGPRRNVNNKSLSVFFCYKKLNSVISDSDFVMLGLDLHMFGSDNDL